MFDCRLKLTAGVRPLYSRASAADYLRIYLLCAWSATAETLSTTTITNSSDPLSCPYHLPHQRLYKPLTSVCHSQKFYHLVIGRTSGFRVDKKKEKKKRKEPKHVRSHLAEWQPEMAHHIRPKQWVTGRFWDERRRKVNAPFLQPTSEHHTSDR